MGKPTHVTEVGTAVTGGRESGEAGNVLETHLGSGYVKCHQAEQLRLVLFSFHNLYL